jgi:hypothetical protein
MRNGGVERESTTDSSELGLQSCNENIGLHEAVVRLRPSITMYIFLYSVDETVFRHCCQCIVSVSSVINRPLR